MRRSVYLVALLAAGCRPPAPTPSDIPRGQTLVSKPVVSNGVFAVELEPNGFPDLKGKPLLVREPDGIKRYAVPQAMVPSGLAGNQRFTFLPGQAPGSLEASKYTNETSILVRWQPMPDGSLMETVEYNAVYLTNVVWPKAQASDALVPDEVPANQTLAGDHRAKWTIRWRLRAGSPKVAKGPEPSLQIDGEPAADEVVRNGLARLSIEARAGSFGPFGVTSDRYGGRMFWDCDVYWLPALAFLDPVGAKQIAEERLAQVPGARKNFLDWLAQARPVGDGKRLGPVTEALEGIMFSWETNHSGAELSTAPTRFEHHGSGSVAFGLDFARRAGLVGDKPVKQAVEGVAQFYRSRIEGGHLRRTVSPDEWRTVDDDLYTNELAAWATGLTMTRYRDAKGRLLQYQDDDGRAYQQVAGLLAAWPLQRLDDDEAEGLYQRVAKKISDDGPGMSYGIHTVVAARLGMAEEAYDQWSAGWTKFSDLPGVELREHQKVPSGYFLTGAAAQINGVLYGFLGLRLDDHDPGAKLWKKQLKSGSWVSLAPTLPQSWNSVRCTLWFDGQPHDVYAEGRSLRVTLKRP